MTLNKKHKVLKKVTYILNVGKWVLSKVIYEFEYLGKNERKTFPEMIVSYKLKRVK